MIYEVDLNVKMWVLIIIQFKNVINELLYVVQFYVIYIYTLYICYINYIENIMLFIFQ